MKIDYVVPMVFPDDKKWQYGLQVARGMMCSTRDATTNVRYRTWGTERLLVQCVKHYMPWVNDIIILLARPSQIQPWMKQEDVRVVLHQDFMPKWALPTFNSSAIEVFLPFIPQLSDHFIYGNDDLFPLCKLGEDTFFRDGLPCQHHNEVPYSASPTNFERMAQNGLNFVAEEFGIKYTTTWLKGGHSLSPIVKQSGEHLWERGADRIKASVSAFRKASNFNQYIFSFYQHLSGQYVDYVPQRKYVSTRNTPEQIREVIKTYQGILCVNDNEVANDITRYAEAVRDEVSARLRTDED